MVYRNKITFNRGKIIQKQSCQQWMSATIKRSNATMVCFIVAPVIVVADRSRNCLRWPAKR